MDDNFLEKLKQDLVKSGFGSELKVRKIFEDHCKGDIPSCWGIKTAPIFFDKDENKSREIDLTAVSESILMNETHSCLTYHLFCEIKKSKSPWMVFKDRSATNKPSVKCGSYDTKKRILMKF